VDANGNVIAPTASPSAPLLQGASCGTIGPQGADATTIMGVNTHHTVPVTPTFNVELLDPEKEKKELPLVPTILLGTLAVSAFAWGIRTLVQKKRAPLWVVGVLAGSLVTIAGFLWNTVAPATGVASALEGVASAPAEPSTSTATATVSVP